MHVQPQTELCWFDRNAALDLARTDLIEDLNVLRCGSSSLFFVRGLGTPEEVRYDALSLLRDIAPGGAYVLGSGHSVQDYVPVANFRAMVDAVQEYGRYPIDIPDKVMQEAEAAAKASHRDVLPELEQVIAGIDNKQAAS